MNPLLARPGGTACGTLKGRGQWRVARAFRFASLSLITLFAGFASAASEPFGTPPGTRGEQAVSGKCTTTNGSSGEPIHLYVPDGQLRSSPVRIYVTCNLTTGDNSVLRLYTGHALTSYDPLEGREQPIDFVASGQSWTESVEGQDIAKTGTVILLNLSKYPIEFYKPMKRVLAVLQWGNGSLKLIAVAERPVNLGNAPAAWAWSILLVVIVLTCITRLARSGSGSPLGLLCADDGHLSLSLTQIALWTLAIGVVIFFYGMIRFEVPTIPNSILILMGLSLGTGALGSAAPPQKANSSASPATAGDTSRFTSSRWAPRSAQGAAELPAAAGAVGARKPGDMPKLADLIYLFPKEADAVPQISLARAQMLFWTVIIIVLFVAKSAIEGVIWDVPGGMVALMGFSQAGYVGPKFIGPYAGSWSQ